MFALRQAQGPSRSVSLPNQKALRHLGFFRGVFYIYAHEKNILYFKRLNSYKLRDDN